MRGIEVRVVDSVDEMASLQEEWDSLSAPFGMPVLDHDWFLTAAQVLHEERDLRVVTVREHGRLTGVAPMVVDRTHRHLVLLGASALFEPSGWIFASETALQHLTAGVIALGEVAVLERVPVDSPVCDLLPKLVRGHALAVRRQAAASSIVRTDRHWDSMCASLSSRTRQRLAAARSRAERECGDVRFERSSPGPDDVDQVLGTLVAMEAAGWKGRRGTALAARPNLARFFRLYAHRAARHHRLRVSTLSIGGGVAAMELGVEVYGRMWGLKIAYDERFAPFAPALQLVHGSLRCASEQGLMAYEFLGSAEPWQARWKPETRAYALAIVCPFRRRALMTALYDAVSYVSRRIHRPYQPERVVA